MADALVHSDNRLGDGAIPSKATSAQNLQQLGYLLGNDTQDAQLHHLQRRETGMDEEKQRYRSVS